MEMWGREVADLGGPQAAWRAVRSFQEAGMKLAQSPEEGGGMPVWAQSMALHG